MSSTIFLNFYLFYMKFVDFFEISKYNTIVTKVMQYTSICATEFVTWKAGELHDK